VGRNRVMQNTSLLLPMNGRGNRFDKYSEYPKPLIPVGEKEMLFWLLDNLDLDSIEKIIIPYNSVLDEYGFEELLTSRYKSVEFLLISLHYPTTGAVETIKIAMETLTDAELNNCFMLMDCDTFYYEDVINKYKKSNWGNAIFYFVDEVGPPIFSYIQIEDGLVKEIKEKDKISNLANCGIFCIKDGHTLKNYCSMLLLSNQRQHNEFYTSGIFDLMIQNDVEVGAIEVGEFECVGTPAQLEDFLREKT